ncbi:FAD-binding protein [Hwanghaeella grinnelliae]|uniref:FAD-binding protein n=1 Tax=Hwanghaeella grinnelliae TaxID=2500179 RepID=A0A437QKZ3_9PROT|nr:FAD-dependent oxidoreductase [Hwanghaeella grinnelliae]RVU35176.1 FAD-binding protein [Hwanghaeella grinnelliae]
MLKSFDYPQYPFRTIPDLTADTPTKHEIVIVGGGPVGLCAALDLAKHGRKCVVLNAANTVSVGSRAICWSKRTLEICDRLGIGAPVLEKGITWKNGRVFAGDENLYNFDLLPEAGHQYPAFVNLQQYYFELFAVKAAEASEMIDLRWQSKAVAIEDKGNSVVLDVETPEGTYKLEADYVLAADGARSGIRRQMGLDFKGQVFEDRFLIADVIMRANFPTERWFWFDPPFNPGQSALLHKQADDVWRIDLQLGWDADPEEEKKPEKVIPRLKRMLGEDADFDLEWVSVYTFQCRRLEKFRHNRVLFVGDSAHQVSPFGARGGNGGIQDTDNLIWKLDLVLAGKAPESLLDTYDTERVHAGDENILNSTRSTDFITPKNTASRRFRDAALTLARKHPFARQMVNSGRLSLPAVLTGSPLNTPDNDGFSGGPPPGAPCPDAPVVMGEQPDWLLHRLGGKFTLLIFDPSADMAALAKDARMLDPSVNCLAVGGNRIDGFETLSDPDGLVGKRFDREPGTAYLIRPDQHVAARWRQATSEKIEAALNRAIGK